MNEPVVHRAVTVNFLDVGQGAATVIVDHAIGKALLIDCPGGKESAVEAALDRYRAELDVAMITHFDDDHSAGVVTLIHNRPCRQLVTRVNVGYRTQTDIAQHRQIMARLKRGLLTLEQPRRDDLGFLGNSAERVGWKVLSPDAVTDLAAYAAGSRNRVSLVLRLEIIPGKSSPSRHFVIAGDADGPVWRRLLANKEDLSCFALLWPHHGGQLGRPRSRLRHDVLRACAPRVAIISVGHRNGHRHPAQSTLDAVRESGARLMCTEVTERCHTLVRTSETYMCSGDVEIGIDADGTMAVTPSVDAHMRVIEGWDRPQCMVRGQLSSSA